MSQGYFIGLISGTSRDGVDAALALFEDERPKLLHALCLPYQDPLKSDLEELFESGAASEAAEGSMLDERLGRHFARAARTVADEAGVEMRDITAIGSHGQTTWHEPQGTPPRSVQLGSPHVIARSTGVTTVSHFRQGDLEAGGQGAPLAPLLHRRLFHTPGEHRAVLNLGGIANLTLLEPDGAVSGYDCGPANCLIDSWIRRHLGPAFDEDGRWAASGEVNEALLDDLLSDPYFSRPPPKSTGLEYFNSDWLTPFLAAHRASPVDVQSTLTELTARTAAHAVMAAPSAVKRLLVCGGGVHNAHLMDRLARLLPGSIVESTQHFGMHPDWVEAVLFAWLARERLLERKQDTGPVTGAREPVLLGCIHSRTASQEAIP